MSDEHVINIADGTAEFIYSDDLIDLTKQGNTTITRVSHVEPSPAGGWVADMRPVDGPILGKEMQVGKGTIVPLEQILAMVDIIGFDTREEALACEREWLRREKGL